MTALTLTPCHDSCMAPSSPTLATWPCRCSSITVSCGLTADHFAQRFGWSVAVLRTMHDFHSCASVASRGYICNPNTLWVLRIPSLSSSGVSSYGGKFVVPSAHKLMTSSDCGCLQTIVHLFNISHTRSLLKLRVTASDGCTRQINANVMK